MYLKQFRQDPFPVFVYEVDGLELEKSVFMVHGENTTVIQYELRGALQGACTLELRPLIAFRDYHSTTHENGAINRSLEIEPGRVTCSPYQGCPNLYLAHTADDVRQAGDWYRNFEYSVEQAARSRLSGGSLQPAGVDLRSAPDASRAVIASTEARACDAADRLRSAEIQRAPMSWPLRLRTIRWCNRWSRPPISSSFGVETKALSSPDTTGSAIGAATR